MDKNQDKEIQRKITAGWTAFAYEYVVGGAKMTRIFAVYIQASGFPSQSSEYAFECCRK